MAEAQRRRPSRMTLSPIVSRPVDKRGPDGKTLRKSRNSPFGGMNMRAAEIRRAPDRRSQAELKRSSGRREGSLRDTEDKPAEPFKALRMQRALSPITYRQRSSIKTSIAGLDTFDQFPLLPIIKESIPAQALRGLEDIAPTPVQRIAIPMLLGDEGNSRMRRSAKVQGEEMEQFLLAAETGSGKTLAYLLPVLDAIKRAEAIDAEEEAKKNASEEKVRKIDNPYAVEPPKVPHSTTGRPRGIILLPTSELVTQVGALAKCLSHTIKFRSSMISASVSGKVIRNRLFSPGGIDLLISTPHLLNSIAESEPNLLSRVTHLVIDEADSLLDRSFVPTTSAIIDRSTPSLKQLILCSATIPRSLDSYLRKRFPDMRRLVTPNLHAIPRRVQLGVVDIEKDPYRGNRNLACADTIWSIGKAVVEHAVSDAGEKQAERVDVKRILVFVNEREKTQEVAEYLQSKGIDAVALNRDTPEQRQSELLESFTSPSAGISATSESSPTQAAPPKATLMSNYRPLAPNDPSTPPRRILPKTKVLVTTDLGSRGIDTVAVRHVVLYDVPHSTIDFIHRLGRTGRMGRRGRGIVLVGKHDRRDVVREVKEGMFMGQALM
ncbi:MAG: RNA helicase [Icmadophila ericetorum]|nr:RNA helicase [Icmadophila ericetorum]